MNRRRPSNFQEQQIQDGVVADQLAGENVGQNVVVLDLMQGVLVNTTEDTTKPGDSTDESTQKRQRTVESATPKAAPAQSSSAPGLQSWSGAQHTGDVTTSPLHIADSDDEDFQRLPPPQLQRRPISLAHLKVGELKEMCKVRGLKRGGKKAELLARLAAHTDSS